MALFGLGQIGSLVAELCIDSPAIDLAAAAVVTAQKDGVDVGELLGREPLGVHATIDVDGLAADPSIDAFIYCGLGDPTTVAPILGRLADHGKDCITVTGLIHPETALGRDGAQQLAARARAGGSRIVGVGWNPGFLLDVLPVTCGRSIPNVRRVTGERFSDLATWGHGVLDDLSIGHEAGTPANWRSHLRLEESLRLVSDALAIALDQVEVRFEPRIADGPRANGARTVEPGMVEGFRVVAEGVAGGACALELAWTGVFAMDPASDGLEESVAVCIEGDTTMELSARGTSFTNPYPATAARALNALQPLRQLEPGLYRPDQLPATALPSVLFLRAPDTTEHH